MKPPQTHNYASFAPVPYYNALQGDLVGGAFWDMRATSLRLNSPLAEQAEGPPLDLDEMGMIDAACVVYRLSGRPYRRLAEEVWGSQGRSRPSGRAPDNADLHEAAAGYPSRSTVNVTGI